MPPVKKPPPGGGEPPSPQPETTADPEYGPRKLIRPPFAEIRRDQGLPRTPSRGKAGPLEQTNAEAFYYLKQMQGKTPLVVRLLDGEEVRGWLEWYDRDVLKINRDGAPNLVIPKSAIKYLYKEEDERLQRRRRPRPGRELPRGDAGIDEPPGD